MTDVRACIGACANEDGAAQVRAEATKVLDGNGRSTFVFSVMLRNIVLDKSLISPIPGCESDIMEMDLEGRQKSFWEQESARDKVVQGVLAASGCVVRGARTLTLGFDAQYMVERNGKLLCIVDHATTPLAELRTDIQRQLDGR